MFKNLKIRTKLLTSFVIVAIITILVGFYGNLEIRKINDADTILYERITVPMGQLITMAEGMQRMRINVFKIFMAESPDEMNKFQKRFLQISNEFDSSATEYNKTLLKEEARKLYRNLMDDNRIFHELVNKEINLLMAKNISDAKSLLYGEIQNITEKFQTDMDSMQAFKLLLAKETSESNAANANQATFISIIVMCFGFILAIVIGLIISQNLNNQLGGDPLYVLEITNKVAAGDLSMNIDISKKKDYSLIVKMKSMVDTIKSLVADTNQLCDAAVAGKLDVRADATKNKGEFKNILDGINRTLDAVISPLNVAAEYVDRISKGDIPKNIVIVDEKTNIFKGDFNEIKNNINQCIDAISLLLSDASLLAKDANEGKLNTRADASCHQGEYHSIISGINNALDSIAKIMDSGSNLMVADENAVITYMNKPVQNLLSKYESDIKVKYPSFIVSNLIGSNIDQFHKNPSHNRNLLSNLYNPHTAIIQLAAHKFKLIISPLFDQNKKRLGYTVQWANYTNEVNFEEKMTELIHANMEGDLKARLDISNLEGNLEEVATKINNMLDLILLPINEASDVLKQMAEGNFNVSVRGDYKGDHATIKNALNTTITMLPLKNTIEVMQAMADGDLTKKITGDYKGDSLALKNAVNGSIESMNEILSQVSITIDEVNRGSLQVSDAASSLSQGATESAASLEEITSSMAEIGSQTKHNAENATIAKNLTNEAKLSAEKGNKEMNQLNTAMSEMNASSRNISKIIKVIDEIAFQTNLLALNAAVEAARAGRHGKGFAVVAEEVRNLAARSASAAKETAELIENSIKNVENGSNLAARTGDALNEIQRGAIKAADIVGEIAALSNEQAQAIFQINEGLSQIDKVTQTNTASAEESASAAEELSGQSNNLLKLIQQFKLSYESINMNNQELTYSPHHRLLQNSNRSRDSRSLPPQSNYYQNPDDIINLDGDYGKY
ncbi:MAG: methyl-accepting chemotaxis protein [Candidatus Kapabacteria bacterium]|nr:methyl-accepting chemotaxis protein [Candidatus Kapabacteria bacterium]